MQLRRIFLLATLLPFLACDDDDAPTGANATLCALPLQYVVNDGPGAGSEFNGVLLLDIAADGSLAGSKFAPVFSDAEYPVDGTVSGKALDMTIDLGDAGRIHGAGEGDVEVRACDPFGGLVGPGTGPADGADGDWATCCCPSANNNFTCPETLPACKACRDNSGGGDGIGDYCSICRRHAGFPCDDVFCP